MDMEMRCIIAIGTRHRLDVAFYAPLLICHKIDTYGIKSYLDNLEGMEVENKQKNFMLIKFKRTPL